MTAPPPERPDYLAWLVAWLVSHHQDEQRSIASDVVKKLTPLWKILGFRNLATTRTPWIEAVLPVVEAAYVESQHAAQRFVVDYRHANLPTAPEIPAITGGPLVNVPTVSTPGLRASSANVAVAPRSAPLRAPGVRVSVTPSIIEQTQFHGGRAAVSLLATGPGEVLHRMPATEQQAMDAGQLRSSRVAVRIVTDGGREVVRQAVELDHDAVGWARVLNTNPCAFCAMLASRGAVYKNASFNTSNDRFDGEGVAKVHDGCRCGLRPVYSHGDSRDATAQALWDEWGALTSGHGGRDALNAFRRGFHPPEPPPAPRIDLHSLIVQREQLVRDGFAEDSEQVAWMDQQIARFGALL